MRKDPALTYRGALAILGKHERPVVEALDMVLGGLILASPLSAINAVGLVDPKNEASSLIRKLLNNATDRLLRTAGYRRRELISAAHSVLVISSFFEALRLVIGPNRYQKLKLNDKDKISLVRLEHWGRQGAEKLMDSLINAEVPLPSTTVGWHENTRIHISRHMNELATNAVAFLRALEVKGRPKGSLTLEELVGDITDTALHIYKDSYIKFASDVPEFTSWAFFGEHAATRSLIIDTHGSLASLFQKQSHALERLEEIWVEGTRKSPSATHRVTLAALHTSCLDTPIVAMEGLNYLKEIRFPSIRDGYVTPAFRLVIASGQSEPSRDTWWSEQTLHNDLDGFLAAHLSSADSYQLPLLVLGDPGAGKSLLTRVAAARLPTSGFAVIRVELRNVEAGATIVQQINQALDRQTHECMTWRDITAESTDVMRIVFLDGLDELIQATGVSQSSYLRQVADFQLGELNMERPIAVIVTSRTIVADRAAIPDGSFILKLEDFDTGRIESWLEKWHSANQKAFTEGQLRPLTLRSALRHADLARQPLLLLMLAVYTADHRQPDPGDVKMSEAELYERLLRNFVLREGQKPAGVAPDIQLLKLGLVAFSMFNRGRQYVREDDLEHDLTMLESETTPASQRKPSMERPLSRAQQAVGGFFFVHEAEADGGTLPDARRAYEFMHSTFGEYLIASTTVKLLEKVAEERDATQQFHFPIEVSQVLLSSLTSHQPFIRRRSIMRYIRQILDAMETGRHDRIERTLDTLLKESRDTHESAYNPSQSYPFQRLAAYTANLLALRTARGSFVPIAQLIPEGSDARSWWRDTARILHAGLDAEGWGAARQTFRAGELLMPAGRGPAIWAETTCHADPELEWKMEDQFAATPERSLKIQVGTVILRDMDVRYHALMPLGIQLLLDIHMRPGQEDLQSVYNELSTTNLDVPASMFPMVLQCLARDCSRLLTRTVAPILERLITVRWLVPPDRQQFARAIVEHPFVLEDDHLPSRQGLCAFGTHQHWVLAFISALASRPAIYPSEQRWPEGLDELSEVAGTHFTEAIHLADSIFAPPGPTGITSNEMEPWAG